MYSNLTKNKIIDWSYTKYFNLSLIFVLQLPGTKILFKYSFTFKLPIIIFLILIQFLYTSQMIIITDDY